MLVGDYDRFLRDVRHYIGDYILYIIKPKNISVEDYAFNLEFQVYKDYGLNIHNYDIKYVDIRDQERDPYEPDTDIVILYDPYCWVEKIEELNNRLEKIEGIASGRD